MIHKIVAVRDRQVNAFDKPWTAPTTGAAIRAFRDALHEPDHPMAKHPEDYELYLLADYDDERGTFTKNEPKQIAVATNLIET